MNIVYIIKFLIINIITYLSNELFFVLEKNIVFYLNCRSNNKRILKF